MSISINGFREFHGSHRTRYAMAAPLSHSQRIDATHFKQMSEFSRSLVFLGPIEPKALHMYIVHSWLCMPYSNFHLPLFCFFPFSHEGLWNLKVFSTLSDGIRSMLRAYYANRRWFREHSMTPLIPLEQ